MKLKTCFIIFCFAIVVGPIISQTYNFKNYSEDNGLTQSYIYNISQSKNGFLTLSTGEGYSFFDGIKFTTLTNKKIADNFVNTHLTDSRNITWLGHFQNGITYIKDGNFNELVSNEIKDHKVSQFYEDNENTVWLSTLGGGLFFIDSTFKLKKVKTCVFDVVNSFLIEDKELIAATSKGLMIFNIRSNRSLLLTEEVKFLAGKNIKQVIHSGRFKELLWVVVEGEGVYCVSTKNGYEQVAHISSELNSTKNNITTIFSDKFGNLWLSLFGEGLRKISFKGDPRNEIFSVSKIETKNGLKNLFIQSIYQDAEGNMWFGTFGEGLIEKPAEKFSFYGKGEGIINTDIQSITVDQNKNIWLGSTEGLDFFNSETNSYTTYNSKNGFVSDKVNALMLDKNYLWIGTDSNGIYRLNTQTMKFENFSKQKNFPKLSVNHITQNASNVFISTKEGVYMYDKISGATTMTTMDDGLFHNNVLQMYIDSKKRQWVCSNGSPPYFIKDKRITSFKEIPELKSFNIHAICEDNSGNIWIATIGDGVFKYDGNRFINYTSVNGLLSDYCYGIEVDKNNSVWVCHRTGLSEKKSFQKSFHGFSGREGLIYYENNANAVSKDVNGDLWFGTTQGIVKYDSETGNGNLSEPKLSITKITLNDSVYDISKGIRKKYGKYSTRIDFLAVSLSEPDKISYKYRLLGLDSVWKTTNMRYVDFPKLGDGEYIFQVLACNGEGQCNMAPVEISFVIDEPLWKKWWFYVGVGSLLIIIVNYVIYLRTRRLKRTEILLRGMVDEKTQLLQNEKEEVEKVKTQLEVKNKDITDSINYAKRIQEALLPSKNMILEKLPETIIYYKPRDIVSGDFYWFAETSDAYIIAAIDCTGHGIPGAFMSLIGSTLLNEIIYDYQITEPAKILSELNEKVIKTLNQQDNVNSSYDGMDMSVCSIAKDKRTCIFSGAHRPLYFINEYGLREIKGSPLSIGGNLKDGKKIFEEHTLHLNKGDMLYVFSDGYSDQFNTSGKKLTTKRFKALLQEINDLDIKSKYMAIKHKFEDWRGAEHQIDDVLVIGIRV